MRLTTSRQQQEDNNERWLQELNQVRQDISNLKIEGEQREERILEAMKELTIRFEQLLNTLSVEKPPTRTCFSCGSLKHVAKYCPEKPNVSHSAADQPQWPGESFDNTTDRRFRSSQHGVLIKTVL